MLHPQSPLFNRLYDQISHMPVVDCHEHLIGPEARPPYTEPIAALTRRSYMLCDLRSAGFDVTDQDAERFYDPDISTDEKWPLFERLWRATEHTVYARVTKLVLQDVCGERELTRESLDRVAEKLAAQTEEVYFRTIEEANIQALLVDVLGWLPDGLGSFLEGQKTFPDKWRPMISLPGFHPIHFTKEVADNWGALVGRAIGSLDDYLEVVFEIFRRCVARGVMGIKDQSAYERIIAYELVPETEAERLFERVLADPEGGLAWPESKPLGDYLSHQFMRFARELDLPVQLHTGYVVGPRSRVDRTNAAYLVTVLEEHQQVRFDLFHGNWPYMGDLLFLGKNYHNVALDLCWLHIIDPVYASELMERAVMIMPHAKVHGFGGDYGDFPEFVAAHLQIARENVAGTLAHLVERGWLEEEQALQIAADWLFNNPNRFFKLGFEDIDTTA
jgi:predicted TIM-barrel fold metal-dependent hydrolase